MFVIMQFINKRHRSGILDYNRYDHRKIHASYYSYWTLKIYQLGSDCMTNLSSERMKIDPTQCVCVGQPPQKASSQRIQETGVDL